MRKKQQEAEPVWKKMSCGEMAAGGGRAGRCVARVSSQGSSWEQIRSGCNKS